MGVNQYLIRSFGRGSRDKVVSPRGCSGHLMRRRDESRFCRRRLRALRHSISSPTLHSPLFAQFGTLGDDIEIALLPYPSPLDCTHHPKDAPPSSPQSYPATTCTFTASKCIAHNSKYIFADTTVRFEAASASTSTTVTFKTFEQTSAPETFPIPGKVCSTDITRHKFPERSDMEAAGWDQAGWTWSYDGFWRWNRRIESCRQECSYSSRWLQT